MYSVDLVSEGSSLITNEDMMRAIREAEEDVKAGRVRSYDEFIEELKKSGEI